MVLWTINDFLARSSLSRWSRQGYKACPTCNEDTPSMRVLGKTTYVGHQRFLKKPHKWRRSLNFNGETEDGDPPRKFNRDQIMSQLARLPTRVKGKHPRYGDVKIKRNVLVELNWTKRSIFYELKYWSFLTLKHNLDIMHIEKNMLESILNTLLMNDKSKDTTKARQDLKRLGIRSGLCEVACGSAKTKMRSARSLRLRIVSHQRIEKSFVSSSKELNYQTGSDPTSRTKKVQETRQRYIDKDACVSTSGELFAFSCGPTSSPISVNSCIVNSVSFVVHNRDERRKTQKSGICLPGEKDGEMYYGQFEEILEFSYMSFKVVLYPDDHDVIHFDNSSDLTLSTSLNDLDFAILNIDGQSMDVDAPPDIIDVDDDDDFIDDEDDVPHDLADFDDEVLANDDDMIMM
ncbi:zinc finger, PHD-type containing protein [Tanacetum coccineum]